MDYINVTIKLKLINDEIYSIDLRIPTKIRVSILINSIFSDLGTRGLSIRQTQSRVIKIETKSIVISDNQMVGDFPVSNGDVFTILN